MSEPIDLTFSFWASDLKLNFAPFSESLYSHPLVFVFISFDCVYCFIVSLSPLTVLSFFFDELLKLLIWVDIANDFFLFSIVLCTVILSTTNFYVWVLFKNVSVPIFGVSLNVFLFFHLSTFAWFIIAISVIS